ncbi:hypothetical protein NIES267_68730 [Calothrix parasitica NIES-267]|uniref:Uncharacterized protein n=1 Tax=Calothrix parasitica NIES-267 TaxID=1973488 RepID=A0A1Z4M1R6_9CYAN|nr:hypothetical protein NIES267_68730 [Calothrix parasitica NIES-267]
MPKKFQKGHKLGFTTDRPEPLTSIVNLRVSESQKNKLKLMDNWQERLRECIDILIHHVDGK